MKRIIITLFAFIFFKATLYPASGYYLSVAELKKRADIIVRGKIVKLHPFFDKKKKRVYTEVFVEISHVFKGKIKHGEKIKFLTFGGTVSGVTTKVFGAPKPRKGEDVILFLKFDDKFKTYRLVGMKQGYFLIKGEKIYRNFSDLLILNKNLKNKIEEFDLDQLKKSLKNE